MRSLVSATLATLLVLPALSCAQEGRSAERQNRESQPPAASQPPAQQRADADRDQAAEDHTPRRLETVTWNSVKHELTWVISTGEKKGAAFKPIGSENYLIDMDDATMTYQGQRRRFSKEEAANVHVLMDVISKYAIDSTVWWDDGQGEPLDQHGNPKNAKPNKKRDQDRQDDNDVAILHVAATAPPKPADLDRQIRQLEDRLAELRLLRQKLGATQLASY